MSTVVTSEQRIEKACQLLLQAPPGEIKEVLGDIRTLLKGDSGFKTRSREAVRRVFEDALTPVTLSSKYKPSLVTKYGRVSDNSYVDHINKITFDFDYNDGTASSPRELDQGPVWKDMFESLAEGLQKYINDFFQSGNFTVYGLDRDGNETIIICIESHIHKKTSFWNGQLNTVYKVTKAGSSLDVKGKLSTIIHYYEEGNVQMISKKKVACQVDSANVATDTKNIISNIQAFETEYQTLLVKQMGEMMEGTFKALRRALPITRTKVDWAKISAYRVGTDATRK